MLEIRKMEKSDLVDVAEIEAQIFSQPWSAKGFEDSLNQENTLYLVALCDGELAGYCGYLKVLEEADITNVAVSRRFRRQGVGRALLCRLLEEGRAQGAKAFTLEVRESNHAARRLYEELGFVNSGVRKNFYELPTENAVIMWRHDDNNDFH